VCELQGCLNYHCPNCCHTFSRDFSDWEAPTPEKMEKEGDEE